MKVKTRKHQIIAFLLAIVMSFLSFPVQEAFAIENNNEGQYGQMSQYGEIDNGSEIETGQAIINKQVSFGDKPGEYEITLEVKGKRIETTESTDIVIVYDNSNSMKTHNRAQTAKRATDKFVNQLLTADNESIRMALITYGSSVFDGSKRTWLSNPGKTGNYSYKSFTKQASSITNKIPNNVPSERTDGNTLFNWSVSSSHGGTFTQQALRQAGTLLDSSREKNKIILLVTDGVPTLSYNNNKVEGTGSKYEVKHGDRTKSEANGLKSKGYKIYTLGVEINKESGISKEKAQALVKDISSGDDYYYDVVNVDDLQEILQNIGSSLNKSIVNGSIHDLMGEFFNFKGGIEDVEIKGYKDDILNSDLIQGVEKQLDGDKRNLIINGLNLGKGERVTISYKVQIDTKKEGFYLDTLYNTNGRTCLTPKQGANPIAFPIPKASAKSRDIEVRKIWADQGHEDYRPDKINVKLMRDDSVAITQVASGEISGSPWEYKFEGLLWYDSQGEFISYSVEEDIENDTKFHSYVVSIDNFNITNTIKEPGISISKRSNREKFTNVGEKIVFTIEVANTGQVNLSNVQVIDKLVEDDSEGKPLDLGETVGDEGEVGTLELGETWTYTVEYTVTSEDIEKGVIINTARVRAEAPNGEEVEDDAELVVSKPSELGEISIKKYIDRIGKTFKRLSYYNEEFTYIIEVKLPKVETPAVGNEDDPVEEEPAAGNEDDPVEEEPASDNEVEDINEGPDDDNPVATGDNTRLAQVSDEDNPQVGQGENQGALGDEDDNQNPAGEANGEGSGETVGEDQGNEGSNPVIEAGDDSGDQNYNQSPTEEPNDNGDNSEEDIVAGQIGDTSLLITDKIDNRIKFIKGDIEAWVDETEDETLTSAIQINGQMIKLKLDSIAGYEGKTIKIKIKSRLKDRVGFSSLIANKAYTELKDENYSKKACSNMVWVQSPKAASKIKLDKSADKTSFTEVGEIIKYTFTVTNNGNTKLRNVLVKDISLNKTIQFRGKILKPGKSFSASLEYKVSQKDLDRGYIRNIAEVTGNSLLGKRVCDKDKEYVKGEQNPAISLKKQVKDNRTYRKGDTVNYEFTITNTGNVSLRKIKLYDETLGKPVSLMYLDGDTEVEIDSDTTFTLVPGGHITGSIEYKITGEEVTGEDRNFVNTAKVFAKTSRGKKVGDTDTETIKISKTGGGGTTPTNPEPDPKPDPGPDPEPEPDPDPEPEPDPDPKPDDETEIEDDTVIEVGDHVDIEDKLPKTGTKSTIIYNSIGIALLLIGLAVLTKKESIN